VKQKVRQYDTNSRKDPEAANSLNYYSGKQIKVSSVGMSLAI
jgi:hypothetical protein